MVRETSEPRRDAEMASHHITPARLALAAILSAITIAVVGALEGKALPAIVISAVIFGTTKLMFGRYGPRD
jgi:hypothetical protein